MSRTKQPLKVPVRLDGRGIFHSTSYLRGAGSLAEAERINDELRAAGHDEIYVRAYGPSYVMQEFPPFWAFLRVEHFGAGDHYVDMRDLDGNVYPMFLTDYFNMAAVNYAVDGWFGKYIFEVCKKGRDQYGIRPVKS